MKKLMTAALAGLMAMSMSTTALAGQWQQDAVGWWYQNDNSSYLKDGWSWVDGKCYYFTPEGYCLTGTQTPDGYTVDETGAWVVDGVVQTQAEAPAAEAPAADTNRPTVLLGTSTVTIPDGYWLFQAYDNDISLLSKDLNVILIISLTGIRENGKKVSAAGADGLTLDRCIGTTWEYPLTGVDKQLANGTWRCYDYPVDAIPSQPGKLRFYAKPFGDDLIFILFKGELTGVDTDSIVGNNLP